MREVLLAFYGELRSVHVAAALVSGLGFALRGAWMLALRPGRPKVLRALCFVLALACYAFIVSVARVRDPSGFLSLLAA